MIHSKLKKLHEFAIDLRRIGMYQTAGDIDYLVSWLVSPEFNNGVHLKPHPAGKNTIDPYSNNCPIPFTANLDLIRKCTSLIEAKYIVGEILKILDYLKSIFTSSVESIAIDSYINYSNKLYEILGGEPGPTPPGPEPPTPVVKVYDYGYMSDDEDFIYMSPRGFIDTSTMELIYGGGENLVIPFDNVFVYGGGVSQYMIKNIEKKAYLRSSAYQNSNKSVSANSENYLYPEGGDATIDGNALTTYTLTGAYTSANVSVSITGASLIVSSSKLKLVWGTTSASVCYITYKES